MPRHDTKSHPLDVTNTCEEGYSLTLVGARNPEKSAENYYFDLIHALKEKAQAKNLLTDLPTEVTHSPLFHSWTPRRG